MKLWIKIMVALLVVATLAGCSLVQVNNDRIVVAQVKDAKITLTDFLALATPTLSRYGIDPKDVSQAETINSINTDVLDSLVNQKIYDFKMAELGIEATPEDRTNAEAKVVGVLEEQKVLAFENYKIEEPTLTEAELNAKADEYLAKIFTTDYTRENYLADTLQTILFERLLATITKDIVVTEADTKAEYEKRIADAKTSIDADMSAYEDAIADGAPAYYTPEGIFYVKHILRILPQDIIAKINTLTSEDKKDEADKLYEEQMALLTPKAEEILAKVQAGDDFDALIAEYGEDPGMTQEPYMTQGYIAYPGTTAYAQGFTDGALTLTQDGQTSGLVKTSFGYHILKRIYTVPAGTIAYDEVKETIQAELLVTKQNEFFQTELTKWTEEMNVELFADKISYQ